MKPIPPASQSTVNICFTSNKARPRLNAQRVPNQSLITYCAAITFYRAMLYRAPYCYRKSSLRLSVQGRKEGGQGDMSPPKLPRFFSELYGIFDIQ